MTLEEARRALLTPLRRRPKPPTARRAADDQDAGYAALANDPEEQAIEAALKARRHERARSDVEDIGGTGVMWRSLDGHGTHTAI